MNDSASPLSTLGGIATSNGLAGLLLWLADLTIPNGLIGILFFWLADLATFRLSGSTSPSFGFGCLRSMFMVGVVAREGLVGGRWRSGVGGKIV